MIEHHVDSVKDLNVGYVGSHKSEKAAKEKDRNTMFRPYRSETMKQSYADSTTGRKSEAFSMMTASQEASQYRLADSRYNSTRRLPRIDPWYVRYSAAFINHGGSFSFFACLTLWVLICDDTRMLASHKPADPYFEWILIFCLAAFSIEIIIASLGVPDYPLSFYFFLDLIATASLILDLPSVQETMNEDADESNDAAAKGKTARLTARVARITRLVRLIRLVKLLKVLHHYIAMHFFKLLESEKNSSKEDDDDDLIEDANEDNNQAVKENKQSRVGKKLYEVTTKRTVLLVLAMLIVVPLLASDPSAKYPTSADIGADQVTWAFERLKSGNITHDIWQEMLLQFIFYHNWWAGHDGCPEGKFSDACPHMYFNRLFFVGFAGDNVTYLAEQMELARLSQNAVGAFNTHAALQDDLYNYGPMPSEALEILSSSWETLCSGAADDGKRTLGFSLISPRVGDRLSYHVDCPSDLRAIERDRFYPRAITGYIFNSIHLVFYFDARPFVQEEAMYGLLMTACVCIAVTMANMFILLDNNRIVMRPLDSMIRMIEEIRDSPLAAVKIGDEEFKREELAKQSKRMWDRLHQQTAFFSRGSLCPNACAMCGEDDSEPMETVVLERTLLKLGTLLALGLGEAGASIICENMAAGDTATVNAMVDGRVVNCIIGQAAIQNFNVYTEILQGKIMTFVNQVAEIVHGVVDEFHGAPNKNTGETFLLIWQLHSAWPTDRVRRVADMTIVAFSTIIGAIHQSPVLAGYREHPGFQYRLGAKSPRVRLNVGLHAGWAWEGAVGSEYKIDASYISPNVQVAANIESATNYYRVPFLLSESIVDWCTSEILRNIRLIDNVLIPGCQEPIKLFCVDLDTENLIVIPKIKRRNNFWTTKRRYKVRQYLHSEKEKKHSRNYFPADAFDTDPQLLQMRDTYTDEFAQRFMMGYQCYAEGEWASAKIHLIDTRLMLKDITKEDDGPSLALLAFMSRQAFTAPDKWSGFRMLEMTQGDEVCYAHARRRTGVSLIEAAVEASNAGSSHDTAAPGESKPKYQGTEEVAKSEVARLTKMSKMSRKARTEGDLELRVSDKSRASDQFSNDSPENDAATNKRQHASMAASKAPPKTSVATIRASSAPPKASVAPPKTSVAAPKISVAAQKASDAPPTSKKSVAAIADPDDGLAAARLPESPVAALPTPPVLKKGAKKRVKKTRMTAAIDKTHEDDGLDIIEAPMVRVMSVRRGTLPATSSQAMQEFRRDLQKDFRKSRMKHAGTDGEMQKHLEVLEEDEDDQVDKFSPNARTATKRASRLSRGPGPPLTDVTSVLE